MGGIWVIGSKKGRKSYKREGVLQLVVSVRMRGGLGNAHDKEGGGGAGIGMKRGRKSTGAKEKGVIEAAALPWMVWRRWGMELAEELSHHAS